MGQERTIVIDGYAYHTRRDAEEANKELEGVEYLKEKMQGQEPDKILALYNKMLDEEIFVTPIGIRFEKDLRDYLLSCQGISEDEVRPIEVRVIPREIEIPEELKKHHGDDEEEKGKSRLWISMVINLVLLVLVVAMFLLVKSSDNVNILNYENELINKYEAWDTELGEREEALREKEKELIRRENALDAAEKGETENISEDEEGTDGGFIRLYE